MPSSLRDTLYQVHLPVFDGPLDLLLHLIEREKLDISTVSLAQVADQFLEYIRALEQIRAEALADFILAAAPQLQTPCNGVATGAPPPRPPRLGGESSAAVATNKPASAARRPRFDTPGRRECMDCD